MNTESITLEMSLKPFKKVDSDYIKKVSEKVFEQWMPLIKDVPKVKVLLLLDIQLFLKRKRELNLRK